MIFLSNFLFAQKNMQDVVYLKNGSIIRGVITEFIPEKSVKIETEGKSIFVFEMTEVEKITREEAPCKSHLCPANIKTKGFFNETEFRLLVGSGNDSSKFNTAWSLQNMSGYQVNRYLKIGGGAGVDHYNEYSHTFIPLFGRISGDMVNYRITPVYFADAGYGFLIEKDEYTNGAEERGSKGGLMIHAGFGLKFYTASKVSASLLAGFKLQRSQRDYVYSWNESYIYHEDRVYRRFTFGAGVSF